jgi:hypothetical protein
VLRQVLLSFQLFVALLTSVVIAAQFVLSLEVQPHVVLVAGQVGTEVAGVGPVMAWRAPGIQLHDICAITRSARTSGASRLK